MFWTAHDVNYLFIVFPLRTDHAGSDNNLFSIFFFWNSSFHIGKKRNGTRVLRLQSTMSFGCGLPVDSIIHLHYAHAHLNPLSLMLKYFPCAIFITWYFRSATLAAIVRARKKIRTLGGEQGNRREKFCLRELVSEEGLKFWKTSELLSL